MLSFQFLPRSSIGRKQWVAATGVMLLGYVILHLMGNLLIYWGPATFDGYAAGLENMGVVLHLIEAVLALIFAVHIFLAGTLVVENFLARPKRYAVFRTVGDQTLSSKWMPYTGSLLLIFIVLHVSDFSLANRAVRGWVDGRDLGLYGVVYNAFQHPWHAAAYIAAMLVLALHLSHAIQSAFQTFGLNHPKVTPWIKKIGAACGYLIAILFITIPLTLWLLRIKP
jgi:succinate dehydrogenase / fumarate reductase, cytochrome b subunit